MTHKNNILANLVLTIALLLSVFFTQNGFAQTDTSQSKVDTLNLGSDELFKIARETAFGGNRAAARVYLYKILETSPTYADVRIFLGRTYTWDDQDSIARTQFQKVLEESPNSIDAYRAYADLEIWGDEPNAALVIIEQGLKRESNDEDLLYKKAKVLVTLEKPEEASVILNTLLTINPSSKDAISLLNSIKAAAIKNNVSVNYNTDIFEDVFDRAHYADLQYGRTTKFGSVFVRSNYSKRFGTTGYQGEVDFYPGIAKGVYAFLNYGYANNSLFPRHRIGAEIYFKLPKSFEGSAGLRYLFFSPSSTATLYTATLGKYYRSYWFSVRTYITPNESGVSNSYLFQVRRYLGDGNNFIGLSGGFGFSPDQNLQTISSNDGGNIVTLRSRKIGIDYQKTFGFRWRAGASYQYAQQQFLFSDNDFIGINSVSLTLRYNF